MAVTGAIFNSLIFGGVDSANYGIYITGEAVYNAPERAVVMVSVPGRNGAIAIDQGRWENIEVEYPAGCFGDNELDFADRISAFRNAVLSQLGYQRLTDTYHPDEFRMAIYVAGLEVEPANINSAGEFKLIFNCKPQRFLTSGETAVAMTSGDSITNPTLYDARPIVQFNGYGNMTIGSYEVKMDNVLIGVIAVGSAQNYTDTGASGSNTQATDASMYSQLNTGDGVIVNGKKMTFTLTRNVSPGMNWNLEDITITSVSSCTATATYNRTEGTITVTIPNNMFVKGTNSTLTSTVAFSFTRNGTTYTNTITITTQLSGDNILHTYSLANTSHATYTVVTKAPVVYGDSTKTIPDTIYLDMDIGEAYFIDSDNLIALNQAATLGTELPVLKPGANTVTYSNTFSNFKITPRWWQL